MAFGDMPWHVPTAIVPYYSVYQEVMFAAVGEVMLEERGTQKNPRNLLGAEIADSKESVRDEIRTHTA